MPPLYRAARGSMIDARPLSKTDEAVRIPPTMPTHKLPAERTAEIIDAALKLASKHGYQKITRGAIADAVGISEALVSYHVGTMPNLRRTLVRQAIARPVLRVLGQAVAADDPHARKAPQDLRAKALASLAG